MTEYTYTYENIIIDPSKEGIKNIIGKEVYFHNNPCLCLDAANENSTIHLGMLEEIDKDRINPFVIKKGSAFLEYSCIIEKKEEPKPKPKYIPFENVTEFLDAHRSTPGCLTEEACCLSKNGIWLKDKDIDGVFYMVTEVWRDGVVLGSDEYPTIWFDLLYGYTFIDGSPCGKLAEENKNGNSFDR